MAQWTDWVRRRMDARPRRMAGLVDLFIAPSRYLLERFRDDFGLPASKLRYLDYGFDLGAARRPGAATGQGFIFGYIGTHIPAKGIHHLLEAFGRVRGTRGCASRAARAGRTRTRSRRWRGALRASGAERVEWLPEYRNPDIVREVFNHVDAIVVPSIWAENSPLVIHEALQARVPVITARRGWNGASTSRTG